MQGNLSSVGKHVCKKKRGDLTVRQQNFEDGINKIIDTLKTPQYIIRSTANAISTYASTSENNDPVAYAKFVLQNAELDPRAPLYSLNDRQLALVAKAIAIYQGQDIEVA